MSDETSPPPSSAASSNGPAAPVSGEVPALRRRPLMPVGSAQARRRVLLVINPSASGVTARNRVVIQNAISSEHDLEVSETHRRGHATRFAQGAAARGFDVVISVGGDGTINEVANGLAESSTILGVLPGGSTNVFARQLGFVNDPEAATEQLLDGLRCDDVVRIGLGNVNGRYFCFHVGMGFDAAVVERVERFGTLKRWLGHPLFGYAAVATWLRGIDRTHPPFSVEVAQKPTGVGAELGVTRTDGYFTVVLNVDPYSFAGPRPISLAPAAQLSTPLSVVTVKSLSLVTLSRAVSRALTGGQQLDQLADIDRVDGLYGLTVRGYRPFPWQVDGDHLGDTDLLDFSYRPEVLSVVRPGPLSPTT
jgi:diacylglycerol kinase family enzyme